MRLRAAHMSHLHRCLTPTPRRVAAGRACLTLRQIWGSLARGSCPSTQVCGWPGSRRLSRWRALITEVVMCPLPRAGHVNSTPPVALEIRCALSVAVLPVTAQADLTARLVYPWWLSLSHPAQPPALQRQPLHRRRGGCRPRGCAPALAEAGSTDGASLALISKAWAAAPEWCHPKRSRPDSGNCVWRSGGHGRGVSRRTGPDAARKKEGALQWTRRQLI